MKLLLPFLAGLALCSGGSVPLDNSHYVEGVSRYIWMPDIGGTPHLIDLQPETSNRNAASAKSGARNKYWLYTRQNKNDFQVLVKGNANSIQNSNYKSSRPTNVLVHGWTGHGRENWINQAKDALLDQADVNVIVLDWNEDASNILYFPSVEAAPEVGKELGEFLKYLFATAGGSWNNLHVAGHSLGSHVVGNVARAGHKPARVTGLDPAGPSWGSKNPNTLSRNSAVYVEIIHTNGGNLGLNDAIGHTDFYPNGGKSQPGCGLNIMCSHERAALFFASSIRSNHLIGRLCPDVRQANSKNCSGGTLPLGNNDLRKKGQGIYGLTTNKDWPY